MAEPEWLEATGDIPENCSEKMAALLMDAGVNGVQVIDANSLPPDLADPPKAKHCRLIFYVPIEPDNEGDLASRATILWHDILNEEHLNPSDYHLRMAPLTNEDWAIEWRKFFHPQKIGRHLWVAPTWEPAPADDGEIVINIDPGLAFGTGAHHTTALVLREIERIADEKSLPNALLDVGTGSGVLSIAAAKMGIESIEAIDVDPESIRVAKENLEVNGITPGHIRVSDTILSEIPGSYPFVCANIISSVLLSLKADLIRVVAKDGLLVLSGILETEADELISIFSESLRLVNRSRSGEWVCLTFNRS